MFAERNAEAEDGSLQESSELPAAAEGAGEAAPEDSDADSEEELAAELARESAAAQVRLDSALVGSPQRDKAKRLTLRVQTYCALVRSRAIVSSMMVAVSNNSFGQLAEALRQPQLTKSPQPSLRFCRQGR
jgi:hypothetical protein